MPRTKYPIFKCLHRGQKGFTLVELLVVIAILGVIAAVAIPNITQFVGSGKTEAMAAEKHNVQVAASAAVYQGTLGSCTAVGTSASAMAQITASPGGDADAVGTYLINNTEYYYYINTSGQVLAQGETATG